MIRLILYVILFFIVQVDDLVICIFSCESLSMHSVLGKLFYSECCIGIVLCILYYVIFFSEFNICYLFHAFQFMNMIISLFLYGYCYLNSNNSFLVCLLCIQIHMISAIQFMHFIILSYVILNFMHTYHSTHLILFILFYAFFYLNPILYFS